ncbi:MAG: type II toxin-antitoxin system HicB family antitoxin [Ottowia sp.]|nr:type II toxin-antitoxin system HicB family antitoxin [Ottowia sp.]
MKYMVVTEKRINIWGAYVPDIPDCVAAGETRTEASKFIE